MAEDTRKSTPVSDRTALDAVSMEQIKKMNADDAKAYFTWTNLFTAILSPGKSEQRAKYLAVKDTVLEEDVCNKCERMKNKLFQISPTIRFLRDEINKLGPDMKPEYVRCRRCGPAAQSHGGGYNMQYGIEVCANNIRNRGHLEDVIAHEMVHGWDDLRFHIDDNNMRHQACTEIRAATLSGECRFMREFFTRNQWKVTKQLQECVRRRATISMTMRPQIKDDVQAARVVNEVWESCFNDTRPFDEIYR